MRGTGCESASRMMIVTSSPSIRFGLFLAAAFLAAVLTAFAQPPTAATLPTDRLLSEPGPAFRIDEHQLPNPLTLIAYGDQRFTDPANTRQTNPRIRQWLVKQIAKEHPAAVIMNGDVPLAGNVANDYAVFQAETKPWRELHMRVFPTLGNHEFRGDPQAALEDWWNTFPEMRNRRWYSAQLGSRVYLIALDSDTSLLPGSDQARWLEKQIDGLPPSIDFVIVTLHHPPVADFQQHIEVDHNPRPNEIALRDYLSKAARSCHASILVSAGHIHNYERSVVEGVTYLVSGGGGAPPYFVERTPEDLYQSILFPNYHYVKLTVEKDRLHAAMYRVENPEIENLTVELKDSFDVVSKPHSLP
jgi:acid phosphatase type 7